MQTSPQTSGFTLPGPPLFEHQVKTVRRIIETNGVCALLLDPGTGKTRCAITYASMLAAKAQREVRVLVLSPVAALDTWVDQAVQYAAVGQQVTAMALGGRVDQRATALSVGGVGVPPKWLLASARREGGLTGIRVISMSLDSFSQKRRVTRSKTTTDLLIEAVAKYRPDLLIVDESHRLKGAFSNVSRAVRRLRLIAPRRLILSGTVMPHSPMDVWGQWQFLQPEAFHTIDNRDGKTKHPMPYGRFQERYAVLGGWQGKQVVGFQNLAEMQDIMARNAIVVRKEDALDLPPVMDVPVPVTLSPKERRAYDDMKDSLATLLDSGALATVPNRLTQMMRLRQITSGYVVTDTGITERVGTSKTDAVASVVNDTLDGESRVVVFAHFKREVADIAAACVRADTDVLVITGDTPPRERERMRKRFGSAEPKRLVLVAQMRTLSLAVNELVTSSHAVFASLSERRDDFVQARDRLNRIGQTGSHVTFWNVVVPGSVDEVVLGAHRDRTDLETAMLRHLRP
jgi:superfamily II DNA or RNA helicase